MLTKETVANICMRHLPMPFYGQGEAAMVMMKADFECSINHWFEFSKIHEVGAKELIRIIKKGG